MVPRPPNLLETYKIKDFISLDSEKAGIPKKRYRGIINQALFIR